MTHVRKQTFDPTLTVTSPQGKAPDLCVVFSLILTVKVRERCALGRWEGRKVVLVFLDPAAAYLSKK